MLFNSMIFLFFIIIVFALYWITAAKYRWIVLFFASYYFYMSWNAKYVFLILFTTAVSYFCALLLNGAQTEKAKKLYVVTSLLLIFSVLFVFKYFNFFMQSINAIFEQISIPLHPVTLTLLLPVGISFYTFQTASYIVDVYKGKTHAEKNFFRYATFVSFFPQLVAGPIERSDNLLSQINKIHSFSYSKASYGMKLITWGLFKKVLIADVLAIYVDKVWDDVYSYNGFAFLLVTLFFSIQIYCDFSGYSDIAIGAAKLFGIDLMVNFKSPYFSLSLREFWNRWHISLSSWFRDYVYIPLGGNRCSRARNIINLAITFTVSGLWHGANFTFILWGLLHGLAQSVCNLFKNSKKQSTAKPVLLRVFQCTAVFIFCSVLWVIFRSNNINEVVYIFANLFTGISQPMSYISKGFSDIDLGVPVFLLKIICPVALLFIYDIVNKNSDPILIISRMNTLTRYSIYIFIVFVFFVLFNFTTNTQFIYFQF